MAARTLGIILSLWLFFAAFAFPRPPASFLNAWLVGLVSGVSALAGMRSSPARFVETALSAWLVASAFLLTRGAGLAFWNDLAVGVLSFAVSLVPGTMYLTRLESRGAHA
jgi:hypothetical protein